MQVRNILILKLTRVFCAMVNYFRSEWSYKLGLRGYPQNKTDKPAWGLIYLANGVYPILNCNICRPWGWTLLLRRRDHGSGYPSAPVVTHDDNMLNFERSHRVREYRITVKRDGYSKADQRLKGWWNVRVQVAFIELICNIVSGKDRTRFCWEYPFFVYSGWK